jgi:hypothetical protein
MAGPAWLAGAAWLAASAALFGAEAQTLSRAREDVRFW